MWRDMPSIQHGSGVSAYLTFCSVTTTTQPLLPQEDWPVLNKAAAGVNVARHAKYSARERSISIPDILLSYHNHTTLAASVTI
ncbi:hypothetical protein J6590_107351 [Homalodisca vitripennis]|nr:hypothetical protein J6590_107351 [Homalodisca vitripennis]